MFQSNMNTDNVRSSNGRYVPVNLPPTEDDDDVDLTDLEIEERDEDSAAVKAFKQKRRQEIDQERDGFICRLLMFHDAVHTDEEVSLENFPIINGRQLDIYHLFLIVNKMGGPNRLNSREKWLRVYECLGMPLPAENAPTSTPQPQPSTESGATSGNVRSSTAAAYEIYRQFTGSDANEVDILAPEGCPLWQLRDAYNKYLLNFSEVDRDISRPATSPIRGNLRPIRPSDLGIIDNSNNNSNKRKADEKDEHYQKSSKSDENLGEASASGNDAA